MEKKHLYYLLFLSSSTKVLPLRVPKTVIKGFGFSVPVLMYTEEGIIKFKPFVMSEIDSIFPEWSKILLKKDNSTSAIAVSQFADRYMSLLDSDISVVFQEQLQPKTLTVKWDAPNKFLGTIKSKHHSVRLEREVPVPRKSEVAKFIFKIVQSIEEFYPSQSLRQLESSFAMDSSNRWSFISVSSYKFSKQRLSKSKARFTPQLVYTPIKPSSIDESVDRLIGKQKVRSLRHTEYSKRALFIKDSKKIDPLDLKLLGMIASKSEQVKQASEKHLDDIADMASTLREHIAKLSKKDEPIAKKTITYLMIKRTDKPTMTRQDTFVQKVLRQNDDEYETYMQHLNKGAMKIDELRRSAKLKSPQEKH